MTSTFDLDAYLERVNYHGSRTPTLGVLRDLHALHPAAIPFENLNPLLGLPVDLDIDSVQRKLVLSARGGYCFEHNALFRHALEALGFQVTSLGARVIWNRPADAITARTHMLLLVELEDGPYLADVGFGGQTLTGPLRLERETTQPTPHEPFRLSGDDDYVLQTTIRGEWRALYRFDLQPQQPIDYELTSWYLSHHPESPFTTSLRIARTAPARRYALLNNALTIHELNGTSNTRVLTSAAELHSTLVDTFGIEPPPCPQLTQTLARLIKP